jgi:hypothetical protein
LRYAALLALVVWVGGVTVLGGVVAPAAFDVLGGSGPAGRTLAGAVFADVLRRFHLVSYVCGGVLLASLLVRAVLGPRPRRFAVRIAIAVVMLGASVWSGLVLAPRIERAQRDLAVPLSTLAADDPRRTAFDRMHGTSTGLQLVPVLGGLALLFWELRD